jgi:hypothetical protein
MSEQVAAKLSRNKEGSYEDPESDLENEILDQSKVDEDQSGSDK